MSKILGVALIGGLLLFFALRYAAGDRRDAPTATATPTPIATTVAPIAPPPASPVPAPTPAASVDVATSDVTACARLADLCSTSDQKVDPASCQKQMADARKMAGSSNVDRSEQCMVDSRTCAAASGCLTGGVGMGAMGEYLKGLGGALSH